MPLIPISDLGLLTIIHTVQIHFLIQQTRFWIGMVVFKKTFFVFWEIRLMPSWPRISLGEEQPGCLGELHPGWWWLLREVCSTLHHFWWRVGDVLGWSWSSCCHGQHYQRAQEPQLRGTPWLQQGRLVLQLLHARHSFLCAKVCGYVQRGTGVQHEMIVTWTFPLLYLPFRVRTWLFGFERYSQRMIENSPLSFLI